MKQELSDSINPQNNKNKFLTPKIKGLAVLSLAFPVVGGIVIGCELTKKLEKQYADVALPGSTFIGGAIQYGLYKSLDNPIEMGYELAINPYVVKGFELISKLF